MLALAAFACATISLAQSPAAPPPATPPETQQTAPPAQPASAPETQQPAPVAQPASATETQQPAPAAAPSAPAKASEVEPSKPAEHAEKPTAEEMRHAAATEDQLKQRLAGKTFYLRGGYQENTLHFNEKGDLDGSSPKASYTLSLVAIDRVKVDKHHVELEGVRYGVHFLGALATEDQSANVDKVKLTSKKKPLKITIDREIVVTPKKQKQPRQNKNTGKEKKPVQQAAAPVPQAIPDIPAPQPATGSADGQGAPLPDNTRHGVTVATSAAEADHVLQTALGHIFSEGIDDGMIATLPDYWRFYYKSVAEKTEYRPSDPAVLRSNQVDKKPKLAMAFEPPSNEYAQNNGVAGMAMYHVIVGPDGKPQEVAVGRPIGFGLDENAIEAIRKASFEPGMKDGKPVPVEVDLTVQFRIYSKRTASGANDAAKSGDVAPKPAKLPGPYSVNLPVNQQ